MNLLLCALLAASASRVELTDETQTIARGDWRFYPAVSLRQQLATVEGGFEVESGAKSVRLVLMTHSDAEHLHANLPYGILAATPRGASGSLRYRVRRLGDYVVLIDNREGKTDSTVHVRLSL